MKRVRTIETRMTRKEGIRAICGLKVDIAHFSSRFMDLRLFRLLNRIKEDIFAYIGYLVRVADILKRELATPEKIRNILGLKR